MHEKLEQVKRHLKKNKKFYTGFGVGVGLSLAYFTSPIVRGVVHQPIGRGISVAADRGISVVGKKVSMNNVSYISADRQGPPSWVIRHKETGEVYTSQRSAAAETNLSEAELSKHLNGLMEHVRGNHFERICLAA